MELNIVRINDQNFFFIHSDVKEGKSSIAHAQINRKKKQNQNKQYVLKVSSDMRNNERTKIMRQNEGEKKMNFEYEINTHNRLCLFSNVKGDFFRTFLFVKSIMN